MARRQCFVSQAAKLAQNKQASCNHAQKQNAALQRKCNKEKEQRIDCVEEKERRGQCSPLFRAFLLGPLQWECVRLAILTAQCEFVLRVRQERANQNGKARSPFSKHYLAMLCCEEPECVARPSLYYVLEEISASLKGKAVVPKIALTIAESNPQPEQATASGTSITNLGSIDVLPVSQQATAHLAEALTSSDNIGSNDTEQQDNQQQASSSGIDSTPTMLLSSTTTRPDNAAGSTADTLTVFLNKAKGCLYSFLSFELSFDVTIGYWS